MTFSCKLYSIGLGFGAILKAYHRFPIAIANAMLVLVCIGADNVHAQSADHDVEEHNAMIEEVVVSASRISSSGFEAPTAVTTISNEEISSLAPATITEALTFLPSNTATDTAASSGVTSRSGGLQSVNLRNLGPQRTLVLVDGRRFVGADTDGVVDLKQIPVGMIERVEVVTGGASASWGSDAVAGVLNLILKDQIEGLNITANYGVSEEGDNEEYRLSMTGGTKLFNERGQLIFGVDYLDNGGVGDQYSRDWGWRDYGIVSNGGYEQNGLPNFIISENVRSSVTWPGGLIVRGPLRGTAFGEGGEPFNFEYGEVFGAFMIGGTGEGFGLGYDIQMKAPLEAVNTMAHMDLDLTEDVTYFIESSFSWTKSGGISLDIYDRGNLLIQQDNAFLPQSVRDAMVAEGLQTVNVGRLNTDTPVPLQNRHTTWRIATGFEGVLFDTDWSWDFYVQHGESENDQRNVQNRIQSRWFEAIDAVVDPVSGNIVCRSTLNNPDNGCVPANIFGPSAVSEVAKQYVMGRDHQWLLKMKQTVVSGWLEGNAFSTWAGPVATTLGATYRREEAEGNSDPLSQQVQPNGTIGAYRYGNQLPIQGDFDVSEVFAEAAVPLAEALDASLAIRQSEYSSSGSVTTWKAGLTYEPTTDIRFRLTRSRDIRAPNLSELFDAGGSSFETIFNPVLDTSTLVRQVLTPNPDLAVEEGDTWTGGIVYQPSWADRLQASIDYFSIEIDGVIAQLSADLIAERCFAGDPTACELIIFDTGGNIVQMQRQWQNLNKLETSGFDFQLLYSVPAWGGDLTIRTLATYVSEFSTTDAIETTDTVGSSRGYLPDLKVSTNLVYSMDRLSLGLRNRYISDMVFDARLREGAGAANTINDNSVPSVVYWDLTGNYSLMERDGRSMDFFFVVNNMFDRDPPISPVIFPGGRDGTPGVNQVLHDAIGRSFKVGIEVAF